MSNYHTLEGSESKMEWTRMNWDLGMSGKCDFPSEVKELNLIHQER